MLPRTPRTEPDEPHSGIRLPPRVSDGKADAGPRMQDKRWWQPALSECRHPRPRGPIALAAPPQRPPPEFGDVEAECAQSRAVGRYGVVGKEAAHDPPQPAAQLIDRLVHLVPQRLLDRL